MVGFNLGVFPAPYKLCMHDAINYSTDIVICKQDRFLKGLVYLAANHHHLANTADTCNSGLGWTCDSTSINCSLYK